MSELTRLRRAMKWQAILSSREVEAAIWAYRHSGLDYGCEAVAHYGGTRRLVRDAYRNRRHVPEWVTP